MLKWTPSTYSKLSPFYDTFAPILLPIGEAAKQRVVDNLGSGSILDIACGTGALLAMAHKKGLACFGTDNAQGMIVQSMKKIPEGKFALASFYDIPFPTGIFDYVVETNAVSGVEISADIVLSEMIRVCKPGGTILIGDYCKASRRTLLTKFIEWMGIQIGDFPHDFVGIFRQYGFTPEVEILGWSGIYQLIKVIKQ